MLVKFQKYTFIGPRTLAQAEFESDVERFEIGIIGHDEYDNMFVDFRDYTVGLGSRWTFYEDCIINESLVEDEISMAYLRPLGLTLPRMERDDLMYPCVCASVVLLS